MVNDGVEACRLYPDVLPVEVVVITNPDQIPEVRYDHNEYTSSEWLTRT